MSTRRVVRLLVLIAAVLSLSSCSGSHSESTPYRGQSDVAGDVTSVIPKRRGWSAETIDAVEYAPDGRGIYYALTWVQGTDSRDSSVIFIPAIDATPQILDIHTPGVPPEVIEHVDFTAGWNRSIGRAPDGGRSAEWSKDESGITVVGPSGVRNSIRLPYGGCDAADWLDNDTLLVTRTVLKDGVHYAHLLLVEAESGECDDVYTIKGVPDSTAHVDKIVGVGDYALFSAVNDDLFGAVDLYRFDVSRRTVAKVSTVSYAWDFDPRRQTLAIGGETCFLVERRLRR